jgi:hypothetical protein
MVRARTIILTGFKEDWSRTRVVFILIPAFLIWLFIYSAKAAVIPVSIPRGKR